MNKKAQFVLVVGVAQFLSCGARLVAVDQTLEASAGSWPKQFVVVQAIVEARDLPIDQYVKLRTLALSGASARLGPRIKNPRISSGGLDPGVPAILEKQREYLRTHVAEIRQRGSLTEKSAQAPQLEHSSMLGPGLFGAALPPPSCLHPMIAVVNGRAAGAVFTPQLPDTHYRIEGCGFGAAPGEVQLEPDPRVLALGTRLQPITLQLDRPGAWSENEIDAHLDPRLSGIPDSSVALVVHLKDGRRAELPGCRFVAVRGEPTPLKTIAASWAKLNATTASSHAIRQLEYLSPPLRGEEIPHDAPGMSALVIRSDPDAFIGAPDVYDFSALNPGWVVESIQIQNYSITCPGDVTRAEQAGTWNTSFDAHGFTVTWARDSCFSFIPPVFRFSMSASQYAVKVWVMGPVGTEPMGVDLTQNNQKHD